MKIEEIMTRSPRACRETDTLDCACHVMWDNDCGVVPVVDGGSRVVGMITDRDICMASFFQGRLLHQIPISAAMSRAVCSIVADDTVEAAEELMSRHQVRRLPVTDGEGRLVGILSLNDIAREAARERNEKIKRVSETGVAETVAAVGARHHGGAPLRT
jgi:CBS domain-containing protein